MVQPVTLSLLLAFLGQLTEIDQNFRDRSRLHPGLNLFGPNQKQVTQRDRNGLRITLPKGRHETGAVGVEARFAISGDFEITVSYEILSSEKPGKGMGAGVKIWAKTASEEFQALTLAHVIGPKGDSLAVPIVATSQDGEKVYESQPHKMTAKSGRLRLTREGAEVGFLVAEGDSERFLELQRTTVGTADVGLLRISVGTAGDPCGVTVQFHDLHIRSGAMPAAAAPKESNSAWITWVIILMVVLAGGAGGWFWYRRRG